MLAVECPDFVERGCALSMVPILVSIAESLDAKPSLGDRTRH
jgi:hypothetical protein